LNTLKTCLAALLITMEIHAHPALAKGLTIAMALTLMSGFVFYRHRGASPSPNAMMAAAPVDSPETKAAQQQVHLDSFYFDQSMPSSKSGMIVPPDLPAFQQQRIQVDSSSKPAALPSSRSAIVLPPEDERRRLLYSSKSGTVFEPHSAWAIVNDSVLKDAKAQDTLK
jgi:hypothetical protein